MTRRCVLALLLALMSAESVGITQSAKPGPLADLKTRAERTNFTETSRYEDVVSFLEIVDRASPLVQVTSFGYTFEGRTLPLAVVGRVADPRPETIRASGRLRVYLNS
jgi:hypothetical protein